MADAPRFAQQALTLVWTLLDLGGASPDRIVVHALEGSDAAVRRQLEAIGVETRTCRPFRDGHPHCNKLRQLEDTRFDASGVVLCDTDLAFAAPAAAALSGHALRAKIVDLPNPPIDDWLRILAEVGLAGAEQTRTSFGDHPTPSVNCNGGLYFVPAALVPALREAWPRWVDWLIARPSLLTGAARVHIDQVAFGLAVLEARMPLDLLPLELNFPTHALAGPKPDVTPVVLHYHDHVDASGFLAPVGLSQVDAAISRVNDVIRRRRRDHFENASFWNFRYTHAPDLGSGIGSRGANLDYKRGLVARVVGPGDSVLDIGCGDLEATRLLPNTRYTGVDISNAAIARARAKRPDWTFHAGALHDLTLNDHDVVLCFDVLIHQRLEAAYQGLLGLLLRHARRTLLVSGYNQPPWHQSEMTFYHEPLTTSLARLVGASRMEIVGGYRDTTVVRVSVESVGNDDISAIAALKRAREHTTPFGRFLSIPGDLISTQFETFGGHTRNELSMVLSLVDTGATILDVGAHIGSYAVPLARKAGAPGLVVAIEPDPANLALLYQNVVRNDAGDRIRVVHAAVGDDDNGPGWQPIRDPSNTGALYFTRGSGDIDCPFVSIDAIVERHAGSRPVDLIKIDVEGQELSALRSAHATLARHRPVVYCEIVEAQLARQGTSADEVDAFLRDRQYVFFRNRGERNSTHDRFDIVPLARLEDGGAFFDCLAVPAERVPPLVASGQLPRV